MISTNQFKKVRRTSMDEPAPGMSEDSARTGLSTSNPLGSGRDHAWTELLFIAPDRKSIQDLVAQLQDRLGPAAHVLVGQGPELLLYAPPPPEHLVTGLLAIDGQDKQATRSALRVALDALGVRVDDQPITEALGLAVIFL